MDTYGATNAKRIIARAGSAGQFAYEISLDDNVGPNYHNLTFLLTSDGSSIVYKHSNTSFPIGQWHHITSVYDAAAQTISLYQDGVLLTDTTLVGSVPASIYSGTSEFRIGSRTGSGTFMNGKIDDVRVYNIGCCLVRKF